MSSSPSRLAYILLIAMSAVCFGGPLALMLIIAGGENSKWPPDRPIEWVAVFLIVGLAVVLISLGVTIRLWLPKMQKGASEGGLPSRASSHPEVQR